MSLVEEEPYIPCGNLYCIRGSIWKFTLQGEVDKRYRSPLGPCPTCYPGTPIRIETKTSAWWAEIPQNY